MKTVDFGISVSEDLVSSRDVVAMLVTFVVKSIVGRYVPTDHVLAVESSFLANTRQVPRGLGALVDAGNVRELSSAGPPRVGSVKHLASPACDNGQDDQSNAG